MLMRKSYARRGSSGCDDIVAGGLALIFLILGFMACAAIYNIINPPPGRSTIQIERTIVSK